MTSSAPSEHLSRQGNDPEARVKTGILGRLLPLPLAGLMLVASVMGSGGFRWGALDLFLVGLIDLLLIWGLHLGTRWLRSIHPLLGVVGSLAIGAVVVFTLWMDAAWLKQRDHVIVAGVALTLLHQILIAILSPRPRRGEKARAHAMGSLLCLVLAAAVAVFSFQTQESTRWHLLKHQRVIGLPLYSSVAKSIAAEEARLQKSVGGLVKPVEMLAGLAPPRTLDGADLGHVVFILVDTWRADTLLANGGDADLMPRLNALASEGTVLSNLHANASWTKASCATIFTGLLPEESGAISFDDKLPDAWQTLAEVFKAAGYSTAAFVTNWIQVGIKTGFGQGFDHFRELRDVNEVNARIEAGGTHVRELYARAEEVNEEVFAWLDDPQNSQVTEQPLFLYLHYLDPHSPYLAGVEENTRDGGFEEKELGRYRQEVRYTDEHLGIMIEGLRARLGADVSFVITSDHGEEFWEHGAWGHGHTLYRELLWVPAVVLQGGPAGSGVLTTDLESRDLFDLSLALGESGNLDVAAWASEHDRSTRYASQYLSQSDKAPLPDQRRTVLRRLDRGQDVVIWSAFGPTREVYDLDRDPLELENRVGADSQLDLELLDSLGKSLRFWATGGMVERTPAELRFLGDLGYGHSESEAPKTHADHSNTSVAPGVSE